MQAIPSLVAMIRSAWACAIPPEADNISRPTYDDEGVCAYFSGKTWEGHTARQLRLLDFAPGIFTQEAFAYYLPAYLIADIEYPEISDTNMERVLYWLDRDNLRNPDMKGPTVIDRLTKLQRSALRAYVVFVQSREKGFYDEECGKIIGLLDEADGRSMAIR